MGGLGASRCPLCRAEFKHFAGICQPLHAYLQLTFPAVMAERDAATKIQEKEEWKAESPDLVQPNASDDPLAGFHCAGCRELAAPPAVLTCGHVVCKGSWPAGCPVKGCVGTAPGGTTLAVCGLIDILLKAERPADYNAALARGCSVLPKAAVSISSDSPENLIGKAVKLHSLVSAGGSRLNGRHGTVEEFSQETDRYLVKLEPTPSDSAARSVHVRAANLRVVESSTKSFVYVHYGRGCDGCGVYPIEGRCYKCTECSEEIGYDVCGDCFDKGVHSRPQPSGRFNQAHRPDHRMEEVPQVENVLHALQRAHPEMSLEEIMALMHFQEAPAGAAEGEAEGEAQGQGDAPASEDVQPPELQ